jgi:hypothetical protein
MIRGPSAFEDDDEVEYEAAHENARRRSWKRWAASAAVRGEKVIGEK